MASLLKYFRKEFPVIRSCYHSDSVINYEDWSLCREIKNSAVTRDPYLTIRFYFSFHMEGKKTNWKFKWNSTKGTTKGNKLQISYMIQGQMTSLLCLLLLSIQVDRLNPKRMLVSTNWTLHKSYKWRFNSSSCCLPVQ